jgi:hypothetical protein
MEVAHPGEVVTPMSGKSPSMEVAHPGEVVTPMSGKSPSTAVPQPLEIEASGPTLFFKISEACPVEVLIYSVNGRLVGRIESERLASGDHEITWDGRRSDGSRAASGVYFARVRAYDQIGSAKLVLVR